METGGVSEVKKERKWLRTIAWIAGIMALTAGIVYLLWSLETYLSLPLEGYATLAYLVVFVVSLLSSATIMFPAPGLAISCREPRQP